MSRVSASLPTRPKDVWARLEAVIKAFEAAWVQGRPPALDDYLPADPAERRALLPELIHAELQYRLQAGDSVRVRDYLLRYPELVSDRAAVLDLIKAEHELRQRREEVVRREDFLEQYPEYRDELPSYLTYLTTTAGRGSDSVAEPEAAGEPGVWPSIPDFEIRGKLGRGGMGVVYRAWQHSLKRPVALKMIRGAAHAGPELLARFRVEAEAVARLQHPNIVQIHAVGEHQGCPYFAMEFVAGPNLDRYLAGTPRPARQAAEFVRSLAQASAPAPHTAARCR
jgi:serine/threonine-protein kinase